jgi:hypothetical protein
MRIGIIDFSNGNSRWRPFTMSILALESATRLGHSFGSGAG